MNVEAADRPAGGRRDRVGVYVGAVRLTVEDQSADFGVAAGNRYDRAASIAVYANRIAEGRYRRHRIDSGHWHVGIDSGVEIVLLLVQHPLADQLLALEEGQGTGQVAAAYDHHVVGRDVGESLEIAQGTLVTAIAVESRIGIGPDDLDRVAGVRTRSIQQLDRVELATTVGDDPVVAMDRSVQTLTHCLRTEKCLGTTVGQRQHDVQPRVRAKQRIARHRNTHHHVVSDLGLDPSLPARRVPVRLARPVVQTHVTAGSVSAQDRQRNADLSVHATVIRFEDSRAIHQYVETAKVRVGQIRRVVHRVELVR